MFTRILVITQIAMSTIAFAGNEGGGGGVGFKCGQNIYLADTYSSLYQTTNDPEFLEKIQRLNRRTPDQIVTLLLDSVDNLLQQDQVPHLFQEISDANDHLKFTNVKELEIVPDHHIAPSDIPCGGKLIQLARQDGVGEVRVVRDVGRMSPVEQALLKMHEIRLRWLIEQNQFKGDTTPVRAWVDKLTKMTLVEFLKVLYMEVGLGVPREILPSQTKLDGSYTWTITRLTCDLPPEYCSISMIPKGSEWTQSSGIKRSILQPIMDHYKFTHPGQLVGFTFDADAKLRFGPDALDAYKVSILTHKPYVMPFPQEVLRTVAEQVAHMQCPDYTYIDRGSVSRAFNNYYDFESFKKKVFQISHGKVVLTPTSSSDRLTPFNVSDGMTSLSMNPRNGLRCR